MTLTYSKPTLVGEKVPKFTLLDAVSGKNLSSNTLINNKVSVIAFICNHCPFVQHIEAALVQLAKEYQTKGISFVAINANDIAQYPQDAPPEMKKRALAKGYSFPYLFDETQEIAKAYDAQCTPEFYLVDHQGICVYHGCFDESRPGTSALVTGNNLRLAIDAVLNGQAVPEPQQPSMGCNIKWN